MTMEQSKYAIRAATEQRLMTKATLTLLGICTGLVADGKLSDEEIRFLSNWMLDNREVIDHFRIRLDGVHPGATPPEITRNPRINCSRPPMNTIRRTAHIIARNYTFAY
jgi:hypothetical protein